MDRLFDELLVSTTLGALVVGLGCCLLVIQERSRTNVGVGVAWVAIGVDLLTTPPLAGRVDPEQIQLFERLHVLVDATCFVAFCVYLSGLLATAQRTPRAEVFVRMAIRGGYGVAALIAVLGILFPAERLNDYTLSLAEPGALDRPGFWMFASCWLLVGVTFSAAWVGLARQQLDEGEHARAVCYIVAVPLLSITPVLPYAAAALTAAAGILMLLLGLLRFSAAQGERGAFLGRFLSPQVAEMVRLQGFAAVMQPREVELTVVCCDLRGFTAYADAVPSQAVIDLLGEYYDVIGEAVADVDGTIKDYAGDGILVLVGAPLPRSDHAEVALTLAAMIIEAGHRVTEHWATAQHPLGLGVGVASGQVTVGAIGSTSRTEYTAVGAPVNLAARLCSTARDGEILVDERTAELAGEDDLEPRGAMMVKGLSSAVPVFAVSGAGGP